MADMADERVLRLLCVTVEDARESLADYGLHVVSAAEKAVLDACAATDFTWEGHIAEESDETAIGRAELARREAKP